MTKLFTLRSAPFYLGAIFLLLLVHIVGNHYPLRWDITEDGIYSLSPQSVSLLRNTPKQFHVKFFFSRSRKQLPTAIKTYGVRIAEVLQAFEKSANGKMALDIYDPQPDTDEEEWAKRYGIAAASLPDGEIVFLGAVFLRGTKEVAIAYFDSAREKFLEYDLAEAIVRVSQESVPKVGVITTLNLMGSDLPFALPNVPQQAPWVVVSELRKLFEVRKLPLKVDAIDDDIKVLWVVHPKNLPESTLYAIDQFVMRGGKLLAMVDPLSRLDLPRITSIEMLKTIPNPSSELERLMKPWGIFYGNAVIGDLRNPGRMLSGGQVLTYPMFVSVKKEGLSKESVLTNQLNEVIIAEGGSFTLDPSSELKMEPLLTTSVDSGVFPDPFLAGYIGHTDLDRQLRVDGKPRVLAALVRGKFKSAFPEGRPIGNEKERSVASQNHLTAGLSQNTVLVVGDTDFIRNENAIQPTAGSGQGGYKPINDNLRFVQAAVEMLAGSEELISLRARGQVSRPFTRLQEMEKTAQLKWRAEDERLGVLLADVERKLNEIQARRSETDKSQLTGEQLAYLDRLRAEEQQVRKSRREVRRRLREDIDGLGRKLILANVGIVPVAVLLLGFAFFYRRYRRMKEKGVVHA